MVNVLIIIAILLLAAVLIMLGIVLARVGRVAASNTDQILRDEMRGVRDEMSRGGQDLRREVGELQNRSSQMLVATLHKLGEDQRNLLMEVTRTNLDSQDRMRIAVENKFAQIQEANERKLEEMRKTVDEKLQTTLEKRLGESFKLVSDRLEAVQRGLGEMQTLATGVGDLKRVLTNVKDRGTWGEYQLGAILEEVLTPDQFARNISTRGNGERVEFAVRLPGRGDDAQNPVWLPIDAKFPKEDYERLLEAAQQSDMEQVKACSAALANAVRKSAKDIHDKYIDPPGTTDFGIMFLPSEGLYAEVLRQPGLQAEIQNNFRVIVAGPTTLSSILSSLRVGFQTLAIEKRAHEVWTVLGAVKTEFGKFGGVLDKVHKQLSTATRTIEESATRTRVMQRKLTSVQQLPVGEAAVVLSLPETGVDAVDDDFDTGSDDGGNGGNSGRSEGVLV